METHMETLILKIEDTVEYKLQQSRIRQLMKGAAGRSDRSRKGWQTRRTLA